MKLLLDEMFPPAVAIGLRRRDIDAVAIQETAPLRGLPDAQVFVAAQLDGRCLVTENVADSVPLESAWRAEQERTHHGLILVAPGTFPRHRPRVIGSLVNALVAAAGSGRPTPGMIAWLEVTGPNH